MDIIDLLTPSQDAVIARLKAGVPPDLGTVHQHVSQDTKPPFVMVGAIDSSNEGGKGSQTELISVELHYVFRGSTRAPLLALMQAGRASLEGQELAAPGVAFETPNWIGSTVSTAGPDGVTYAGISTFEFYAEPA
jgi:hypothetical protein